MYHEPSHSVRQENWQYFSVCVWQHMAYKPKQEVKQKLSI